MADKEIQQLLDKVGLVQRRRVTYHAKMGDGNEIIQVSNPDGTVRTGYVWALVQFGDETATSLCVVRNRAVAEQYGMPILVTFGVDGVLEVVSEDVTISEFFNGFYGSSNTPTHGWTHSLLGADPIFVSGLQVLPGLVHPTDAEPDLYIAVEPFYYVYNGTQYYFPGASVDLSSYVPAVEGDQVPVVICHDPATNTATVYDGTPAPPIIAGDDAIPYTGDDLNDIDCSGDTRLAGLRLYYDQTQIKWTDMIDDMRETVGVSGVTDHGSLSGLTDDDHAQYLLLAGRSGGQVVYGGTDASDSLVIDSTSNGTKGSVLLAGSLLQLDETNAIAGLGGAPVSDQVLTVYPGNDGTQGVQIRQHSAAQAVALLQTTDSVGMPYTSIEADGTLTSYGYNNDTYGYQVEIVNSSAVMDENTDGGTDKTLSHDYEAFKFDVVGFNMYPGFVTFDIKTTGAITDDSYIEVELYTDDGFGAPGIQQSYNYGRVYAYDLGGMYSTVYMDVSGPAIATGTYWIVLRVVASGGSFVVDTQVSANAWAHSPDGASWTNENSGAVFAVYYRPRTGLSVYNDWRGIVVAAEAGEAIYAYSNYGSTIVADAYNNYAVRLYGLGGIHIESDINPAICAAQYSGDYVADLDGAIKLSSYTDQLGLAWPGAPAAGYGRWYTGTDDKPRFVSLSGSDYDLTAGGGGNHNALSNIQGGASDDYYHLLAVEHDEIADWLAVVELAPSGAYKTPSYWDSGTVTWPGSPAAGYGRWYTGTDNKPRWVSSAGADYDLALSGSGGSIAIAQAGVSVVAAADVVDFKDFVVEDLGGDDAGVWHDLPHIFQARLTLESGVPISITDQTAKDEIFLTPYHGAKISLYDGTRWTVHSLTEISILVEALKDGDTENGSPIVTGLDSTYQLCVGMVVTGAGIAANSQIVTIDSATQITLNNNATADGSDVELTFYVPAHTNIDIFVADVSGSLTLSMEPWSDDTTRSVAVVLQDGIYVNTDDKTKRLCGTGRITSATGQIEVSRSFLGLSNVMNRVRHTLYCYDSTDNWAYKIATWRAANNNTSVGVGMVVLVETLDGGHVEAINKSSSTNVTSAGIWAGGIGVDSTSVNSSHFYGDYLSSGSENDLAVWSGYVSAGYHYIQRLEIPDGVGDHTWYGDRGIPDRMMTGMEVQVEY